MAAASRTSEHSGIFWANDAVSDEEQPLSFIPGVDGDIGPCITGTSAKRSSKVRARRSSDCKNEATVKKGAKKHGHLQSSRSGICTKEKVSAHQISTAATEPTFAPHLNTFLPQSQIISETSRTIRQACLKDLCPEDKRRIANLIEELARVSEQKEESVQRLKDEQENFERKIQQLEQQNLIIAQERESLQQQYKECQELLGLYQQYLSQQQAKLNQSIAQLSQTPAHTKVLRSEEVCSRTSTGRVDGSLFDGSYLGIAAIQPQQHHMHRTGDGGRGADQTCSNHGSFSCVSEFSSTDGQIKRHKSQKNECRESNSESYHRCEHCQCTGQNSVGVTQQQRSYNGSSLENSHQTNRHNCERLQSENIKALTVEQTLTRPLLGREDWEEKRHHLLLQKMQLEMERERLQARLIEQEDKLRRQDQQLCQTHLDYSRFKQATQAELSNSNTKTGDPQPEGPSHQDLPSSVHEVAEVHPEVQHSHIKSPQPAPAPRDIRIDTHEALEQSGRGMATSPAKSPAILSKPTSLSVMQTTPDARLDFSVVELLEIFSPVSSSEQSKPSARRTKMTQSRPTFTPHKPMDQTLLTPAVTYSQSTHHDLEESQILEDIFFIC
ncbi:Protein hinderin [Channa argus]|uniref:Protein hinderin n=1 Tax=Channa argus TaxID=215402 RepID=A0A6G1PHC0_CHAAH|nr:Protein hinderin [Channa argus]